MINYCYFSSNVGQYGACAFILKYKNDNITLVDTKATSAANILTAVTNLTNNTINRFYFPMDYAAVGNGKLSALTYIKAWEKLLLANKGTLVVDNHTMQAPGGGWTADMVKLAAADVEIDDYYNGMIIKVTGGTGSGQIRRVTDWDESDVKLTVNAVFAPALDDTSIYEIYDASDYLVELGSVVGGKTPVQQLWEREYPGIFTPYFVHYLGTLGMANEVYVAGYKSAFDFGAGANHAATNVDLDATIPDGAQVTAAERADLTDQSYVGKYITFLGTTAGEISEITAFNHTTRNIIYDALSTTPTGRYLIYKDLTAALFDLYACYAFVAMFNDVTDSGKYVFFTKLIDDKQRLANMTSGAVPTDVDFWRNTVIVYGKKIREYLLNVA